MAPNSRANQASTQTGCRFGGEGNPTCAGPCDRTVSQTTNGPKSVQRGDTITVQWNRHNHPGGFIRFAWSPTTQSDLHASFDSRVDRVVCKEIGGCGPANPQDPTGDTNGQPCATTITVPTYLTNGAWTLQWAYFGGWYNAGDYYACVDYTITGGPTGAQPTPFYKGGDVTYPNENVCLFYSTNALHVCTAEPCNNGTFPPGNQKGAALGYGGPIPSTTGKPPAVTTGKPPTPPPASVTTGVRASTTGTKASTTGTKASTTGPRSSSSSSSSSTTAAAHMTTGRTSTDSTSCTLGYMRCSTSETYQSCYNQAGGVLGWGVNQPCPSGLTCHPSGNYIYCY